MAKFHWLGGSICERMKEKIRHEWFMLKVTFWSLTYNTLTSWGTVLDTALEPLFWFVDHFVRYLGPAFVVLVVCLTTSVVVIFYTCLLPEKYNEYSIGWVLYHVVVGHWLLVNIVFHYFKAAFTSPGNPPEKVPNVVSICKKCIGPKPPRAHHCSVCDRCILKMDHHCPWLNNCVGHFNHRYFFLFCIYMWLGTVYVTVSAYKPFKDHFYGTPNMSVTGIFYPLHMARDVINNGGAKEIRIKDPNIVPNELHDVNIEDLPDGSTGMPLRRDTRGLYFHHYIMYEFMLCSAVAIALGLLTLWHARLIHRSETSIETHINRKEKQRLKSKGLVFRNPYGFGSLNNWKRFLGLTNGRTFWRHVLLPSSHKPDEDGMIWDMSTNVDASLFVI